MKEVIHCAYDLYRNTREDITYPQGIRNLSLYKGARLYWHDVAPVGYNDGFFWISYEALKSQYTSYGCALWAEDRPRYEPALAGRIGLAYPDRYNLSPRAGFIGQDEAAALTFFDFHPMSLAADVPIPENALVLDITDLEPAPAGADPALRFLAIRNPLTGKRAAVLKAPWSVKAESGVVEVKVPAELLSPGR